jgi:lantibiotic transport system ATP-binding protein
MITVQTCNLSKKFESTWVVQNVNLSISEGCVFGFLGRNGSGKTTTLRMLLGLLKPSLGTAHIVGHCTVHARKQAALCVGALIDARSNYENLTGKENLEITRKLLDLKVSCIARALSLVDLDRDANKLVAHYSLGMRQRLGIARAMLASPKLLILDEPMNGLDPEGVAQMRTIIRSLPMQENLTVLLSSHNLAEVQQIATHIGVMRAGQLVLQGGLKEMIGTLPTTLSIRSSDLTSTFAQLSVTGFAQVWATDRDLISVRSHDADGDAARISQTVQTSRVSLLELSTRHATLEDLYLNSCDESEATSC